MTFAKRTAFLLVLLFMGFFARSALWAQQNSVPQKFALVIGNGNYTGISRLNNPVNDANDMEAALRDLGFTVEKVLDGNLEQMENAVMSLSRRLGASRDSYGFFFYAGHGVQAGGGNYLIPVAANILNETQLRERAVSLNFVLDALGDAGNELNMVVLDACRDNPFSWSRSGSRGLTVISGAPSGSIVMYATGANSVAADGTGRNGLFTSQLLGNLRTQGLSVYEVFERTISDVSRVTGGSQQPELSIRYGAASTTYLGERPDGTPVAAQPSPLPLQPAPMPVQPADEPRTTWQRAGGSRLLINAGAGAGFSLGSSGALALFIPSASFEYLFSNGPSLGAYVAYSTYSYDVPSYTPSSYYTEIYTVTYLAINGKVAWNFNLGQNILPYMGLMVGPIIYKVGYQSSYNNSSESFIALTLSGNTGIRFFFSNNVGAFVDGVINFGLFEGLENIWVTASLGLALKF